MFGILNEAVKLVTNTTKIILTPAEIALKLINIPVEDSAKACDEMVKGE